MPQVIDAKGDSADCQPGDQSRNMAAPAERFCNFVIWKFCNLKIAGPPFPLPQSRVFQITKLRNYPITKSKEFHD
jgi:hypothetical protein